MAIIAERVDKVCTTMLESAVPYERLADAMNGGSNAKVSLSPTFYAARLWKHVESLVSVGKPGRFAACVLFLRRGPGAGTEP